jgi:hypothetical protein
LHDTWEKLFLADIVGSSGTIMGLPREVAKSIVDFSGLKEDVAVATQLISFGTILGLLNEGARGYRKFWLSFKEGIVQELQQCSV